MPRSRDGESASAARAATAGASSPTSGRSRSSPRSVPVRVTVSPSPSSVYVGAHRASISRSRSPGWVVIRGQPGTVTRPPVTAAAARKAPRWRGRARSSTSRRRPGRVHAPPVGLAVVDRRRRRRRASTVIAMCGSEGDGPPSWQHVDARRRNAGRPAAAPRRTGCDADASIITLPPGTAPAPRTSNGRCRGRRRRPHAQTAQAAQDLAHRPGAGMGVAVEGDAPGQRGHRRHERITVPASPQSTVGRAAELTGGDRPVVAVRCRRSRQRGQRSRHQLGVTRPQGAPNGRRTVAQRGQDQRAVGQRLRPGEIERGATGRPAQGRPTGRSRAAEQGSRREPNRGQGALPGDSGLARSAGIVGVGVGQEVQPDGLGVVARLGVLAVRERDRHRHVDAVASHASQVSVEDPDPRDPVNLHATTPAPAAAQSEGISSNDTERSKL